jgi:hypothetical protein
MYTMRHKVSAGSLSRVGKNSSLLAIAAAVAFSFGPVMLHAQDATATQTKSASQSGTIKSAGRGTLVLTNAAGQDVTFTVGDSTKILIVPPGSKTLSSATPGTINDAAAGDKALITGSGGDTPVARVILMKSGAIAQAHAADAAAWAQGGGGIVKSVNGTNITISSGMKTITVQTTPSTVIRRYSGASVKFEDAVESTIPAIQPGDQLRVRGTKSPDGSSITADEIVTGSFRNFSGTIASIDTAAGTISLKDLTTKKNVTVALVPNSDVRRLPAQMANMVAMRMRGGASGGPGAAGGARPAGAPGQEGPGGGRMGGGAPGAGGPGAGGAGGDLSRMLSRLPSETIAGLKTGEAVMIVASVPNGDAGKDTAITLLVGVEPILAAPAGEATTLSPWNMGGGMGGGGDMGGGMGGPN